ncbi:MAG: 5'/3'-nucleotidase SurE [Lachnospiraceae bacterium]|nr:5'/3'-nucleotidase SurE [Lachnospiraceae bacterium]
MRILITNDDGIWAPGLRPLVQWAKKLGQVTVAAPKVEQSGKSHGIELHRAFEVKKVELEPDVEAYAVDSTPADCVRYALLGLGRQFDLVISGINRGLNIGQDIIYSGTVGAIFEAVCLGVPAIAFSTDPQSFDSAVTHLDMAYDFLARHDLLAKHNLYNINIPLRVKGIRITRQGGPFYSDDFPHIGDDMYQPTGKMIYMDSHNDELDTDAVHHGYISITPLTVDRTDWRIFGQLSQLHE